MSHEACLTAEELLDLWNDRLPAERERTCNEHLEHCPVCRELADALCEDEPLRAYFRKHARPPKPLPDWLNDLTQRLKRLSVDGGSDFEEALSRLEAEDPEVAQVVSLRVFSGLTVEEAAAELDRPTEAVERDWAYAQAWLFRELTPHSG